MSKIGLVCEGGGMKCAYGAGVLDKFLEYGLEFPYCIGVSAGAGNLISYLGHQPGRNLRYYVKHNQDPRYFGVKAWLNEGSLFGIQYIYGETSKPDGVDPIDYNTVLENPAEYIMVSTHAETGEPVYFHKEQMSNGHYQCLMASVSIPAICKPIEIDGQHYYDGGCVDAIPVKKAMDDGCDKVVVILSKSRNYVRQKQGYRFLWAALCRKYPKIIEAIDNRPITYKACQDALFELERQGKAFIFSLETDLKISTYTMDIETNQKVYELGLQDFEDRKDALMEFIEE